MSLTLIQNLTAIVPGMTALFEASGGAEPYVFSVVPGGAGGSINPTTGEYVSSVTMGETPQTIFDTIVVTDDDADIVSSTILVASPLFLLCDILKTELGLENGRVFLWDQKIFQPSDNGLYVIVSESSCKPFSNNIEKGTSGWSNAIQSSNFMSTVDIDIISRGPAARDRKGEIILALNSIYAQSQQEANGFYIGKLPPSARFVNLSMVDGAAIPYRFRISINLQYAVTKTKTAPYFDTFADAPVFTNP